MTFKIRQIRCLRTPLQKTTAQSFVDILFLVHFCGQIFIFPTLYRKSSLRLSHPGCRRIGTVSALALDRNDKYYFVHLQGGQPLLVRTRSTQQKAATISATASQKNPLCMNESSHNEPQYPKYIENSRKDTISQMREKKKLISGDCRNPHCRIVMLYYFIAYS